jgi:riboflavin kinase/FMN adenylyltransferase
MDSGESRPLLEVHLFDFSEDLYGQRLEVEFVSFLRGEFRFESLALLQDQIQQDAELARRILTQ